MALAADTRRFLAHIATTGLGSSIVPGVLAPAKAYRDRAGRHTRRPAALGT